MRTPDEEERRAMMARYALNTVGVCMVIALGSIIGRMLEPRDAAAVALLILMLVIVTRRE